MINKIRRLKYWFINFKNYPKELNNRAGIEQQLWDVYHNKRELPDREQCKQWAISLGVPNWWSNK